MTSGWDRLGSILDEGGYTCYDYGTAGKLLAVFGNLKRLYEVSANAAELETNLKKLGKGIGSTTVSAFLGDMTPMWPKAEPRPTPLVTVALKRLGVAGLRHHAKKH